MLTASQAIIDRFLSKIKILPCGCWEWTGAKSRGKGNKQWYGSFRVGRLVVRAHRFSSEVFNQDECPPGHHRDHRCNNSLCVNPDHIEVVTHEENQRRKEVRRALETPVDGLPTHNTDHRVSRKDESRRGSKNPRDIRLTTKKRSSLERSKDKSNRVLVP